MADAYRREAAQQLIVSEGWRVLLAYILERLPQLDTVGCDPGTVDSVRHDAMGRRMELMVLLNKVYQWAGAPSPMDTHRAALWHLALPTQLPEAPVAPLPPEGDAVAAMRQTRRRGGGAV